MNLTYQHYSEKHLALSGNMDYYMVELKAKLDENNNGYPNQKLLQKKLKELTELLREHGVYEATLKLDDYSHLEEDFLTCKELPRLDD